MHMFGVPERHFVCHTKPSIAGSLSIVGGRGTGTPPPTEKGATGGTSPPISLYHEKGRESRPRETGLDKSHWV